MSSGVYYYTNDTTITDADLIHRSYYNERIGFIIVTIVMTLVIASQLIGVGIARQWWPFYYWSGSASSAAAYGGGSRNDSTVSGHHKDNHTIGATSPNGGTTAATTAVTIRAIPLRDAVVNNHEPTSVTVSPVKLRILVWVTISHCFVILYVCDPQSIFGILHPALVQWTIRNMIACYAHIYRIWIYGNIMILYRDASRPVPKWIQPTLRIMCITLHVGAQIFPLVAYLTDQQLYFGLMAILWTLLAVFLPITSVISACLITRMMRSLYQAVQPSTTTTNGGGSGGGITSSPQAPVHKPSTPLSPQPPPSSRYHLQTVATASQPSRTINPKPHGTFLVAPSSAATTTATVNGTTSNNAVVAPLPLPPPASSDDVMVSSSGRASPVIGGGNTSTTPRPQPQAQTQPQQPHKSSSMVFFTTALYRLWGFVLGSWLAFMASMIETIRQAQRFFSHASDSPEGSDPHSYAFAMSFVTLLIAYVICMWYTWYPLHTWISRKRCCRPSSRRT